jgi:hypothetical protein
MTGNALDGVGRLNDSLAYEQPRRGWFWSGTITQNWQTFVAFQISMD